MYLCIGHIENELAQVNIAFWWFLFTPHHQQKLVHVFQFEQASNYDDHHEEKDSLATDFLQHQQLSTEMP